MKTKNYKIKIVSLLACVMAVNAISAHASEVTGTLSTGLGNNSMSGMVVAAPTASPVAGTYIGTQNVTLASSGSLSVRYTVDGSTPTCSFGTVYTSAIQVIVSETIKSVACYPNNVSSPVSSHVYVINSVVVTSTGGGGGGGGGGGSSFLFAPQSFVVNNGTTSSTTQPIIGQVLGASTSTVKVSTAFNFLKDLKLNSKGNDVTELQKVLVSEGFLKVAPTGFFGGLTKTALINWQKKNKLPATGFFGPMSRAVLNKRII